jgi:hypothetical protein
VAIFGNRQASFAVLVETFFAFVPALISNCIICIPDVNFYVAVLFVLRSHF